MEAEVFRFPETNRAGRRQPTALAAAEPCTTAAPEMANSGNDTGAKGLHKLHPPDPCHHAVAPVHCLALADKVSASFLLNSKKLLHFLVHF